MTPETMPHALSLATELDGSGVRWFYARCSCGWESRWQLTNRAMGDGRRHLTAMRKRAQG